MSEDYVQNVSKSVCSAQKAYLLCISNDISGLGPFFLNKKSESIVQTRVVNRIFFHFPVISESYNGLDNVG